MKKKKSYYSIVFFPYTGNYVACWRGYYMYIHKVSGEVRCSEMLSDAYVARSSKQIMSIIDLYKEQRKKSTRIITEVPDE